MERKQKSPGAASASNFTIILGYPFLHKTEIQFSSRISTIFLRQNNAPVHFLRFHRQQPMTDYYRHFWSNFFGKVNFSLSFDHSPKRWLSSSTIIPKPRKQIQKTFNDGVHAQSKFMYQSYCSGQSPSLSKAVIVSQPKKILSSILLQPKVSKKPICLERLKKRIAGDFEVAVADYAKLNEQFPNSVQSWFNWVGLRVETENFALATFRFEQALSEGAAPEDLLGCSQCPFID